MLTSSFLGTMLDYIFYIFYTAYDLKETKKRWFSTSKGRKADALKAFMSILVFYGLIAGFTYVVLSGNYSLLKNYRWIIPIIVLFIIMFIVDVYIGKRYTNEKLQQMDERYSIGKTQARIVVGILILIPFALMCFLPGMAKK